MFIKKKNKLKTPQNPVPEKWLSKQIINLKFYSFICTQG